MNQLVALDWAIVAIYFVAVFGIAFWVIRRKQKSTADYFLAGKNVGWFVVGASLFASNIGSEHLVGLAGAGAESGVVFGHLEFQASIILLLLGWVFVPFYARSGVFTMPEFLERRYSPAARWYLSVISIIGYVLTKICVTIYAGGVVFETLMGIEFWTGAIAIVVLTGIYTVIGGLRAVIYTEVMQTGVLIAGAIAVTAIGLAKIADGARSTRLSEAIISTRGSRPRTRTIHGREWSSARPSSRFGRWASVPFGRPLFRPKRWKLQPLRSSSWCIRLKFPASNPC